MLDLSLVSVEDLLDEIGSRCECTVLLMDHIRDKTSKPVYLWRGYRHHALGLAEQFSFAVKSEADMPFTEKDEL